MMTLTSPADIQMEEAVDAIGGEEGSQGAHSDSRAIVWDPKDIPLPASPVESSVGDFDQIETEGCVVAGGVQTDVSLLDACG
jgi:hypothetical protein